MQPITHTHFRHLWETVCKALDSDLRAVWRNPTELTSLVIHRPDSLCRRIASALSLEFVAEYYHTDGLFYEKSHLVQNADAGQTWVSRARIAFEHENQPGRKLYEELSHLVLLDCDLRVLVTYSPEYDATLDRYLANLHQLVSASDRAPAFASQESILVIFGWWDPRKPTLTWRPYIYLLDRWDQLPEIETQQVGQGAGC